MKKTHGNMETKLIKADGILEQDLKDLAQNDHASCVYSGRALIYESLLFFHGMAFAHQALKSKIELKGELKNHENQ